MEPTRKRPELEQTETVDELPKACSDELAAVEFLEAKRWGATPCCVHCGSVSVYQMRDRATGARNKRFLWRCRDCGKQYTVRVGTIFEDTGIPLRSWCRAFWEAGSAKNGVSALEMSRKLQITYKSALFMMHRIRHAMADDHSPQPKLSGTVEMDETYCGGKIRGRRPRGKGKAGWGPYVGKTPVTAIVQRGGPVRARVMPVVNSANIAEMLRECVAPGTTVCTDESRPYRKPVQRIGPHKRVNHSCGEYVKSGEPSVHTNTVEGFFARLKRTLHGTYHSVSREHLHRYVDHAAFLYNARKLNDGERITALVRKADGKRLRYREAV